MATFRTLQPGLLSVTRDDGASMVVPMSEQDALAQGLQPDASQAPALAPPEMSNPYSISKSPDAVAGIGGGPVDTMTGAGVYAEKPPSPDPRVVAQQLLAPPKSVSHETAPASKFDVRLPGEAGGPPKPPDLVQVGAGKKRQAETPEAGGMDPLFADYIKNGGGGGGGGRPKLAVTGETREYNEPGRVDPALAEDIKKRQDELDQSTSNSLEDQALHKGDYLEQQAELERQQALNVQDQIKRRQAIDAEIQRLNTKSQTAQDELANAKPKQVDQFWKDKGVGVRLAAGVAMIFGGQLALRTGGENQGDKMVNQMIDRWTNDQIQAYSAAKDKATLTNNAYKDALATYGSPELARTNLQLQALAAKDALVKNTAEQIGTQDALGQAQLALQDSQLKREQLTAQAQQLAGAHVTAKLSMTGGGGGNDPFARIKKAAEAKKGLDYLEGNTDVNGKPFKSADASPLAVRFPDGSVRLAGNSREKTQSQKIVRSAHGAIEDIARLQQLTKDASSRTWGSEDEERAKTLAGGLTFKAHDAIGVATFQQATKDMMHEMIGNPAAFFRNPSAAAKLDELKRQMEDEIRNQKKFLAPAGKGSGGSDAPDETENDLPDSAQEITE